MSDEYVMIKKSDAANILAALAETRAASIEGCAEGYGKPQDGWADRLYRSHGGLTRSINILTRVV